MGAEADSREGRAVQSRVGAGGLLHYRPWRGEFREPGWAVWPIARVALLLMFRRKLFWALYALGLVFFFMFFFGQYLLAYAETQPGASMLKNLRATRILNGSAENYRTFLEMQAGTVMMILALAGSVLVGNDFRQGGVPFYLGKPILSWHYLLGKGLAVAVFVNLMTTLPALILFAQYGMLTDWDYYLERADLLFGILAYGLVLTVFLSCLLLALSVWLRRTVPLIMAWAAVFLFLRLLVNALVIWLDFDVHWRLLNLWNDLSLVGNACLGLYPSGVQARFHPEVAGAAVTLGVVCLLCLTYLNLRMRAVEVVT
jgi:hypothetical protein